MTERFISLHGFSSGLEIPSCCLFPRFHCLSVYRRISSSPFHTICRSFHVSTTAIMLVPQSKKAVAASVFTASCPLCTKHFPDTHPPASDEDPDLWRKAPSCSLSVRSRCATLLLLLLLLVSPPAVP